jgi:hypothetical protein
MERKKRKSFVAPEFSALADVLQLFFLDQDCYKLLIDTGNTDKGFGELLNNPALLVPRQAFFLFKYDNRHKNTLLKVWADRIFITCVRNVNICSVEMIEDLSLFKSPSCATSPPHHGDGAQL